MKIGDRVFVRGYIDEIRKDTVIIRNAGGYFGTIPSEVITGALPPAQPDPNCSEIPNNSDTISRQAAIDIFDDYNVSVENGELEAYSRDRKRLCELPSAQPERKTGRWIEVDDPDNRISGRCSVCGWEALLYETDVVGMDYCPNCGARLEDEKE